MTLIILPNLLDDYADIDLCLPKKLSSIISSLDGLIAESEKNARKYLLRFLNKEEFNKIKIRLLNEHTKETEIKELIQEISDQKWGLISDAGLPCIADPGSTLVRYAKEKNIQIQAIPGPSSIFLALMLSGLNAQKFSFQGYLPREENILINKIRFLELESSKQKLTQIFIEAPYRSDKIFEILKKNLKENTLFSVAVNLTSKDEKVVTKTIKEMKKTDLKIGKNPAIFLFQAY
jgi:16S rRNA (cytidine1402-2'-O)-methyltransferase